MQSIVINRSSIVSERDIFATSSETELKAFYGSLFAMAAGDGSVDIDELDLLFKTINLDKFSDSAKNQIHSYTASPPSLSDCLQTLRQSEETLRLGVMYFLINIAWANKTLQRGESEAIQSAKKLLAVSDLQIQAMQEFIANMKQIQKSAPTKNQASASFKSGVSALKTNGISLDLIDPKGTTTNPINPKTNYSDDSFWAKLKNFALTAGREVVEKALILYYTAQNPNVPAWAKGVVLGALTYFISPADAIPDILVGIGFTDDLGVLLAALATVSVYINADTKEQAKQKMKDWFC
ncbi:YkvA family protein [Microcoleus sp. B3-D2]|uniref:YkvA family protein n=1 Tax=Microcoleus sp. B3-C5 TaxID=2818654 RepID=UPI002FD33E49